MQHILINYSTKGKIYTIKLNIIENIGLELNRYL